MGLVERHFSTIKQRRAHIKEENKETNPFNLKAALKLTLYQLRTWKQKKLSGIRPWNLISVFVLTLRLAKSVLHLTTLI